MTAQPRGLAGSGPRLRRGLRWFLVGRAASGVLGLVWLALLVRTLPPGQLGGYFGLWSLFELLQLASGLGGLAYLQRFAAVDALHAPPRRFAAILLALLGWRLATLAAAGAVLVLTWTPLAAALGLATLFPEPAPLLALLAAEGTVRWCESAADSLLLQPLRQLLALLRNVLRIGALALALGHGEAVDVAWVVQVEAACATLVALCGLAALSVWTWHQGRLAPAAAAAAAGAAVDPAVAGTAAAAGPAVAPWRERLRFAWHGHLALVLGLAAGLDCIRLLVGATAGVEALAAFGTAAALADMAARHTPALLLLDFARSVLTARSTGRSAAAEALFWPRLLIRTNALVLAAVCALAFALGESALRLAGSHAPQATAGLLCALLLLQFVQSLRVAAGLVAHLRADNRPVLQATLTTLVVPLVVGACAPSLGAWAAVLGLWWLELVYAAVLLYRLRVHPARLLGAARLWHSVVLGGAGAGVTAAVLAALLGAEGIGTPAALASAAIAVAIYVALLRKLGPLAADEIAALSRLRRTA